MGAYYLPEALTPLLSREYVAVAAALKGFAKKCLVVDLDDTLWGGVAGEDGVAKLEIGGGYPGNIYRELQQVIYQLSERGVILAINSKNNQDDAWEVFERRPEMVLRREHFSAWRINWQDKATNLQAIAQELGVGLDSCVVLDDNPTERAWVEEWLPEVYVLPAQDPLEMLRVLATTPLFDTLDSTAEDQLRAKSYTAAAQRRTLQANTTNLAEFLSQLDIEAVICRPTESQLGRVAQLTQRTNQFNLTTRRYTHEQIKALWTNANVELLCCEVRDKFADEGIVGVVILHKSTEAWSIDTFLLSCRVLGRGVEGALLWAVCHQAATAGARWVYGEYVRSAKNGQIEGFYREAGFTPVAGDAIGSHWTLALPAPAELRPTWISLSMIQECV
jgi:FkbH-like protein